MKIVAVFAFAALLATDLTATAEPKPEYPESFDPAKGFKPAQRDLTEVFLQLASSLEANGSPEPYLRHMAKEHSRIETLYRQKFGKAPRSFRPDYMTDVYLDKVSTNWKLLSPKLGLEPYAKDFGRLMRDAIKGTRGPGGTILVDVFKRHQEAVFRELAGKSEESTGFEALKADLIRQLELDKAAVIEAGYEAARREAVRSAITIQGTTMKLFAKIDQGLKPDAADAVKTVLTGVIMDTGRMAQSELEAGIAEWAVSKPSEPEVAAYDASRETKLSNAEQKLFNSFLAKARLTKSDFTALDRFYKDAYDRLTDEGKDEMSKRIWEGTRR